MPRDARLQDSDSRVRWCRKCGQPDRDLALHAMRRAVPGSVGWERAMASWSPEPCECDPPDWDPFDD